MSPEDRAAEHLFGRSDFRPYDPDLAHPDPNNMNGPRVSFNELVVRYRTLEKETT